MTVEPADGPFSLDDLSLLASLGRGNDWLRAVLCTLARRGRAVRLAQPERARAIIDALTPWPLYKGGQFLFDLMEWEDFMVDGPAPDVVSTTLDARAFTRLARTLDSLRAHLDGEQAVRPPASLAGVVSLPVDDRELPPLDPGFHLYRDVVLGAVVTAGPQLAEAARRDDL